MSKPNPHVSKLRKAQELQRKVLRDAIREARADGMTLEDVGRVLGISRQAVHYYEKGRKR